MHAYDLFGYVCVCQHMPVWSMCVCTCMILHNIYVRLFMPCTLRFCDLSNAMRDSAEKNGTKLMWNEVLGFLGEFVPISIMIYIH
ncbi:hypothetical protein EON63_04455 [archaeon]|nr:MAG: hypothetical protein EON63_04455 [archaeon]